MIFLKIFQDFPTKKNSKFSKTLAILENFGVLFCLIKIFLSTITLRKEYHFFRIFFKVFQGG